MCRQSESFPAFFTPATDRPLIIDCGANIGVTLLEWKHRWPGAEVICFEPDPHAFRLLQMNVDRNDIPSVRCINAAVDDCSATATLYGHIAAGGDARGNSIDRNWGWRPGSDEQQVACQTLSPYIAGRCVDFLKLDIEGVEERVLREIANHLDRIAAIYVEVHETAASGPSNSAQRITQLLQDAGFQIEIQQRDQSHSLPAAQRHWQGRVAARQTQLLCWK
jgi:FkbM family methyltransferase